MILAALVAAAALAHAAPAPESGKKFSTEPAAPATEPAKKQDWLKAYPLQPYREIWSGALEVKKLDAALPKVVAAVEKSGGRLSQPMANFPGTPDEQQVMLVVPLANAKALLKELRKIGKHEDPLVRRMRDPTPLPEVREKLARLLAERADANFVFGKIPATAELVDALIAHLSAVVAIENSGGAEVLWNITVRERR
jgi:hypothetical protein